ncbi:hypothetical protein LCGC14_0456680 [marine sediment metagenome]|uniref:DUF551 domain-containing protein n=1 Tax=marine sediment metagenome TaxID=412755 RepID=A0A0F9V307_9ZZZZ
MEWIDVRDRLPEDDSQVLTYMQDKSWYGLSMYFKERGSWFTQQHITHWMPLSPPPKEE